MHCHRFPCLIPGGLYCGVFDHDTGKRATEDAQKQRVRRTVHNMKEIIFTSVGTARLAVDAVTGLLSTPEVRELQHAEYWFDAIGDFETPLLKNDKAAIPLIIANVRRFLQATDATRRGTRDLETNNAIKAVCTALVGSEEDMEGKRRTFARLLGLTHNRVISAIQQRAHVMESTDSSDAGDHGGRR